MIRLLICWPCGGRGVILVCEELQQGEGGTCVPAVECVQRVAGDWVAHTDVVTS